MCNRYFCHAVVCTSVSVVVVVLSNDSYYISDGFFFFIQNYQPICIVVDARLVPLYYIAWKSLHYRVGTPRRLVQGSPNLFIQGLHKNLLMDHNVWICIIFNFIEIYKFICTYKHSFKLFTVLWGGRLNIIRGPWFVDFRPIVTWLWTRC